MADLGTLDANIDRLCYQLRMTCRAARDAKQQARTAGPSRTPVEAAANRLACESPWGNAGYAFMIAAEPLYEAFLSGRRDFAFDLLRPLADTGKMGALVVGRLIASPRANRAPHPGRRSIPLPAVHARIAQLGGRLGMTQDALSHACYQARTAHFTRFTPATRAAIALAAEAERMSGAAHFPHGPWEMEVAPIIASFLEGRAATQEQLLTLATYGSMGGLLSVHLAAPPSAYHMAPAPARAPRMPHRNRGRTP